MFFLSQERGRPAHPSIRILTHENSVEMRTNITAIELLLTVFLLLVDQGMQYKCFNLPSF